MAVHRHPDRRTPSGVPALLRAQPALLATLVTALVVGGGSLGGVLASWSAGGSGNGAGSTTTSTSPVTLAPGTPTATLYPGSTSGVSVAITNPGTVTLRVARLALDTSRGTGGYGVDAGHAGCAVSALTYTTQDGAGSGWTVTGGSTLSVTLPGALQMSLGAADACQGATFSVYLKALP